MQLHLHLGASDQSATHLQVQQQYFNFTKHMKYESTFW